MDNKAQSSVKRDGIPPERETKRLRPTEVDSSPTLSPELFAKVLECKKFFLLVCVSVLCVWYHNDRCRCACFIYVLYLY